MRISWTPQFCKMKSFVAIVALSFVAVTCALPVDIGVNSGLIKDDLNSWKNEFVLAGQKIQLGVGWKKDGTIAAGGRVVARIDDQEFPLSAAISTNINEPKKIQYEVGTKILDKISGILYGSVDGALKYLITASTPVSTEGKGTAVGVSLEGDHLKPKTVSAGVSYGSEVIQALVGLGDDYQPESVNVQIGGDPADLN